MAANTTPDTVRLAVVGAGVIGTRHLAAIEASDRADLVAIADANPATEAIASQSGVAFYPGLQALLANDDVDGVIVATPTAHHFEPTMVALDANKHVLVEKPIMPTLEEAQQIIDKSAQTGMQVLVGHQRRYYSLVHKARELLQSGILGQLLAVSGIWSMRKPDAYFVPEWRHKWEAGPVLTNLIHDLDVLRYLCGELYCLSAEVGHVPLGLEKEDSAALVMQFESGALGTFVLSDQATSPWSWECATGENSAVPKSGENAIRFMGTKASLEFPNLALWHHAEQTVDWSHSLQREDMPHVLEDAYLAQINHFCAVIRNQESPLVTALDATNTLKATLAVFESVRSGSRVILGKNNLIS